MALLGRVSCTPLWGLCFYIYIYIDVFSFCLFQNPHNSLVCSRSIIYLAMEQVLWFWYVSSKDSLVLDIWEISFSHCSSGDKHMSELKFKIFLSLQSGNANIGSHIMMENVYFSFCYNPTTNNFRVILRGRTILHLSNKYCLINECW